jgi:hypothetical protein
MIHVLQPFLRSAFIMSSNSVGCLLGPLCKRWPVAPASCSHLRNWSRQNSPMTLPLDIGGGQETKGGEAGSGSPVSRDLCSFHVICQQRIPSSAAAHQAQHLVPPQAHGQHGDSENRAMWLWPAVSHWQWLSAAGRVLTNESLTSWLHTAIRACSTMPSCELFSLCIVLHSA